jgi:hypothetical protein
MTTESQELLEGEAAVGGGMIMTQREWAADLLQLVSDNTRIGSYPQKVTAFDLGRAVGRALTNSNESDDEVFIEAELFRGMLHYRERKKR